LCWALDRMSRRGYKDLSALIDKLADYGGQLWSKQEEWLQTVGPFGEIVVHMLWRTRSGFLFGTVTEPVAENVQCWLDLPDRAQTTWQVADLIRRSGGDMDEIERYRLDVRDMVTGEHVSSLKPSFPDLEALRDGSLSTSPAASPGLACKRSATRYCSVKSPDGSGNGDPPVPPRLSGAGHGPARPGWHPSSAAPAQWHHRARASRCR
jgi:hypothetical protein